MDAMIFLAFVLMVVIGVAFLALTLKFLDVNEQAADQEQQKRPSSGVSTAESIAASVPAFFGRPRAGQVRLAALGYNERLPRLHEIDHRHILWALERAGGDHAQAAQFLGTNERTFGLLVQQHCGASPQPAVAPAPVPVTFLQPDAWTAAAGQRDAFDDGLVAFIQGHVRTEQALVNEFVHLPSIDNLYRQARPSLRIQ